MSDLTRPSADDQQYDWRERRPRPIATGDMPDREWTDLEWTQNQLSLANWDAEMGDHFKKRIAPWRERAQLAGGAAAGALAVTVGIPWLVIVCVSAVLFVLDIVMVGIRASQYPDEREAHERA